MKNLQLSRTLVFIDLETTGLSVNSDRIIELTAFKIHPDGTEEFKSARINPEMSIPAAATKINGITDEDVADKPKFRQYALSLRGFLEDCDIGGFGIKRFDLPLLEAEFNRAGIEFSRRGRRILDAQIIYHKLDPRDLAAAYKQYCSKDLKSGHCSEVDVKAAAEVLDCQLDVHPELPRDVDGLHKYCNPEEVNWIDAEGKFVWAEGEAVFGFGQYKGRLLRDLANFEPGYFHWIANGDFSTGVKEIAIKALNGDFPEPESGV